MKTWITQPISQTCEHYVSRSSQCGLKTDFAYPAMGRGWMALCYHHAGRHLPNCTEINELLANGETLEKIK